MSGGRKRVRARSSTLGDSESEQAQPSKKRAKAAKMAGKWTKEYDKELDTATWLHYEIEDRDRAHIKLLRMQCTQFRQKLEGMRNYNKGVRCWFEEPPSLELQGPHVLGDSFTCNASFKEAAVHRRMRLCADCFM